MWWEIEDHLEVVDNRLHMGGLDTNDLAKKHGTPLYIYNLDRIETKFKELNDLFDEYSDRPYRIHFAVKANPHPAVLQVLERNGAFLDTVSPGEVEIGIVSGR